MADTCEGPKGISITRYAGPKPTTADQAPPHFQLTIASSSALDPAAPGWVRGLTIADLDELAQLISTVRASAVGSLERNRPETAAQRAERLRLEDISDREATGVPVKFVGPHRRLIDKWRRLSLEYQEKATRAGSQQGPTMAAANVLAACAQELEDAAVEAGYITITETP